MDALAAYVAGNLDLYEQVSAYDHEDLKKLAAADRRRLQVTADTLQDVLQKYRAGAVRPEALQRWASFVRRGYFPTSAGAVEAIDVDYDERCEQLIADVISRMDEIGDMVDGEFSMLEAAQYEAALGEAVSR